MNKSDRRGDDERDYYCPSSTTTATSRTGEGGGNTYLPGGLEWTFVRSLTYSLGRVAADREINNKSQVKIERTRFIRIF